MFGVCIVNKLKTDRRLGFDKVYVVVGVLSLFLFLGIYGIRIINPFYTDWLLAGGDLTQHYLGWRAFRESSWHFPLGMIDNLAYPHLVSIIFTDSIPLFALFFKLFAPVLPSNFQYFGIWGAMCFILQGIFTARIIKKVTNNSVIVVLCSVLSVLTPVMLWRMFFHTALAGQWIIIYSFYLFFDSNDDKAKHYLRIALISFLASSIHIYSVLMCGIVLAGSCFFDVLKNKRVLKSVLGLSVYLSVSALIIGLLGGFNSGMEPQNEGLGAFGMNLNSFFNPRGWSCIIQDYPIYCAGQSESFEYLGFGFIFLSLIVVVLLSGHYKILNCIKDHWKLLLSLLLVYCVALVIALSPVITYGDHKLFELNLPKNINDVWAIFRATNRIGWVCIYVIELAVFIIIIKSTDKTKLVTAVLCVAFVLQIYDMHVVLSQKYSLYGHSSNYETLLNNDSFWNVLANNDDIVHLVYYSLPDKDHMYSLTDWALDNDLTVSNFYFARSIDDVVNQDRDAALNDPSVDTVFIFPIYDLDHCYDYNLYYYYIDGVIVGYVNEVEGFTQLGG